MDTALGYTTFLPYGREITGGRKVSEQSKAKRAAPAAAETATATFRGVTITGSVSTMELAVICAETTKEDPSSLEIAQLIDAGIEIKFGPLGKKLLAEHNPDFSHLKL